MTAAASVRTTSGAVFRSEIEGLRAVAALLVATWHIWVGGVSGGVDVFFVLSGFLITTTLLGHIERYGRVRPAKFLGRLARRLLPLALVVLCSVLAATWFLLPESLRERAFREIFASALYFENWQLAFAAVDYLDAEDPHTPVQHFWAMSVQGQFYLIWAMLFVAVAWVAMGSVPYARRLAAALIGVVVIASFAYSVWYTDLNQPFAYFSTLTRVWEFAIGAFMALIIARISVPRTVAFILGWIGLVGLVLCGIVLPVGSSFPGAAALWPVISAVLLLVAGQYRATSGHAAWLLSLKPMVWLGGISYGIYLWHFPIVIFYRHALGSESIGIPGGLAIIATSTVLAWATTRLIERPLRTVGESTSRRRFVVGGALVVVACLTAGGTVVARDVQAAQASKQEQRALNEIENSTTLSDCFGANAMLRGTEECSELAHADLVVPSKPEMKHDNGMAYDCYTVADAVDITTCSEGSERQDALRIALVGNSHAAMYYEGLRTQLDDLNWRLDVFTGNGCVWGALNGTGCDRRIGQIEQHLFGDEHYDVLLVTAGRGDTEYTQARADSYLEHWRDLESIGTRVVVVTDNPRLTDEREACVESASAEELIAGRCDTPRSVGERTPDTVLVAAQQSNGEIDIVDTTDLFCSDSVCPTLIGNVIVYRDAHHLTATYVRSMAPIFIERFQRMLADGE